MEWLKFIIGVSNASRLGLILILLRPISDGFPHKENRSESTLQTQTVLILGYTSEEASLWVEAFHQRGLKVVMTASPADVKRIWQEGSPMLTVMDTSIPVADSLSLCRDLRVVDSAPILLILASASDLNEAYRIGVTECLVQPASPAVILLKALAWSMRSEWANIHPAHEWTPSGSFFQNSLTMI